ncbi:unnamed protein product [Mytilus coruscus]|uniref:Uncharacterized protein n=1 Tax=Mytilus coruscus TaxID=42192 RepID=A0A6J8B2M9_MYTCO|nr:unnamed protein product [Mytilus coruscus]
MNTTRTRIWFGGPDQKILSVDGVSFDPSKYLSEINYNGFSVIIKHFSIEDMNHEYRCSYGFDEYSNSLSIDDNYESNPTNQKQELNYTLRYGILNVYILMKKVHPIPSCSICLKDTYLLSTLPSKVKKDELFYNVEFNTSHKVEHPGCGAFKVLCIVGSTKYILIDTHICDTQGSKYRTLLLNFLSDI